MLERRDSFVDGVFRTKRDRVALVKEQMIGSKDAAPTAERSMNKNVHPQGSAAQKHPLKQVSCRIDTAQNRTGRHDRARVGPDLTSGSGFPKGRSPAQASSNGRPFGAAAPGFTATPASRRSPGYRSGPGCENDPSHCWRCHLCRPSERHRPKNFDVDLDFDQGWEFGGCRVFDEAWEFDGDCGFDEDWGFDSDHRLNEDWWRYVWDGKDDDFDVSYGSYDESGFYGVDGSFYDGDGWPGEGDY